MIFTEGQGRVFLIWEERDRCDRANVQRERQGRHVNFYRKFMDSASPQIGFMGWTLQAQTDGED